MRSESDLIFEGYVKSLIKEETKVRKEPSVNDAWLKIYNPKQGIYVNIASGEFYKQYPDGWWVVDFEDLGPGSEGIEEYQSEFSDIIANIAEALGDGADWSQFIFDNAEKIKQDKQKFIKQLVSHTETSEGWSQDEVDAILDTVENL